jgi:hypothetical protein
MNHGLNTEGGTSFFYRLPFYRYPPFFFSQCRWQGFVTTKEWPQPNLLVPKEITDAGRPSEALSYAEVLRKTIATLRDSHHSLAERIGTDSVRTMDALTVLIDRLQADSVGNSFADELSNIESWKYL